METTEVQPKKPFWKSKTLWGIILTALQMILKKQGIEIPVIGADNGEILTGVLGAIGMRDAIGGGISTKTTTEIQKEK